VIIDYFNSMGITVTKLETDAPTRIHRHGPLVSAIALQLVQADAFQRTQVIQALRHIERRQQIQRRIHIEPAKMTGTPIVPNFSCRRISPGAVMAKT
jgi:hypothetical protein